jgi:hypothetical protein
MKSVITTPEQILEVWEKKYEVLSKSHREDFLAHPITEKLCEYQIFQIEAAMDLGRARYLPEVLCQVKFYAKKTKEDVRESYEFRSRQEAYRAEIAEWKKSIGNIEFAPKRPVLVPNPNVAKYDKYICAYRVTHGRSDECRCRVAA